MIHKLRLKQFWAIWVDCLKALKYPKLLTPFLLFAFLEFLILGMLLNFYEAPFAGILVPLIKRFFGEQYLHYPNNFVILPFLFQNLNLLLTGVIGVVIVGMAISMFAEFFRNQKAAFFASLNLALSKYWRLIFIWFIETVAVLLITVGGPICYIQFLGKGGGFRAVEVLSFFVGLWIFAVFAYATIGVIWDGLKIREALKMSLRIFVKNWFFTYVFIFIPNIIIWPFNYLASQTGFVLSKFNPQMVVYLLMTVILLSIFTNYFLVTTLTRCYLFAKGE
jgi:hypothetical protein